LADVEVVHESVIMDCGEKEDEEMEDG